MNEAAINEGRQRRGPRSHAERSAATRQSVLDAALRMINAHGYAGATIAAIREEAGVSTGALNHQFPSKAQLMAALVERYSQERVAAYEDALRHVDTPMNVVKAVAEINDAILQLPETSAINEIHLARRNDPELDKLTRPTYEKFSEKLRNWLEIARSAAGLKNDKRFDAYITLSFAVYRGLAMDAADTHNQHGVAEALSLWREFTLHFYFPEK